VGPKKTIKLEIKVDKCKGVCFVTKSAYDENEISSN
jgi:hypothetical protein